MAEDTPAPIATEEVARETPTEIARRVAVAWGEPIHAQMIEAGIQVAVKASAAEIERLTRERDEAQAARDAAGFNSTVAECITWLAQDNASLTETVGKMREALSEIAQWAAAYPLGVFPEPDFAKAREVLESVGLTLDAVSASNMRHALDGVGKIARAVLATTEPDGESRA